MKILYRSCPSLISCFILAFVVHTQAQTWETLANVPDTLSFPVVTVLNGKIHVMGGGGSGGATTAHYQYDPATNTWKSVAPVPYKAQQPAGAANNGKIHFFGGGYPNSGSPVDKHYIYDPEKNSWTEGAKLTKARAIHYGISVNNQLYSLAGQGMDTLCQVYDANANSWITKKKLPDSKFWYGAHIAANGKMYRFCGGGYKTPVNSANEYDPETDTWSNLPDVPYALHGISGAAVGDLIYLVGGYRDFDEQKDVIIYNTKTQEYSEGIPLPVGRDYHFVVAIDSCIYSIGGSNAIDKSIGVSLIRLCLNKGSSTTSVTATQQQELTVRYNEAKLFIRVPSELVEQKASIDIFDIRGLTVYSGEIVASADGQYIIDASGFLPAVYYVRVNTTNATYHNKVVTYR